MTVKWNRPLLWLAVFGMLMYSAVVVWNSYQGPNVEDLTSSPPVSKAEAVQAAAGFWQKKGIQLEQSRMTAVYQANETIQAYLGKNGLSESYDKKYGSSYPLDFWEVSGGDGESDYVAVVGLKEPRVIAWRQIVPAVPVIPRTDRLEAEKALIAAGFSLADFHYSAPGPKSDTHLFVSAKPALGKLQMKLEIDVRSGEVTGFVAGWAAPSEFAGWFAGQKRLAAWFSFGSLAGTLILAMIALVFAILYARRIAFSRGIVLTLIFLAIYILNTINSLPGAQATGGDHLFYLIFQLAVIALMAAAMYLSVVTGDRLWREQGWNAWPRWREAEFGQQVFYGMGRGYLICLFVLGLQQVLFLIAEYAFKAFSVSDPGQSLLNMRWPLAFPTLAWMAGISEEILFRLFSIIVFRLLLRSTFAAVLLSAFLWSLGHAAYAIYPSYTRLFEVTVLGLIFGYTFLKYGLITAIFTHATMDSILMALSLITTGKAADIAAGAVYMALPAMVGLFLALLHRRFRGGPRETAPI